MRHFRSLCALKYGWRLVKKKKKEEEHRSEKKRKPGEDLKGKRERYEKIERAVVREREWVRELKKWLGCSLRGRIWLAMASQGASCCSKQPVDKCEIWFLSPLTTTPHYGCTQITTASPQRSPHGGNWRQILFTGCVLHQCLVLTWHLCHLKTCGERAVSEMDVE